MPDRFTVLIDTSRRTYDYRFIYWTFDSETQKGYAWTKSRTAHARAKLLNDRGDALVEQDVAHFQKIHGLEELWVN